MIFLQSSRTHLPAISKTNIDGNPLFDLLYADLTLRLQNIQLVPEKILEERHLQWDSYIKGTPLSTGKFEQWPPEGSTPTEGWILTNWHQSAPYNNFCPLDLANGGHEASLDVPAVTMAQILNYHNTTMNVVFDDSDDYYHNYGGNNYWIDNNYVQHMVSHHFHNSIRTFQHFNHIMRIRYHPRTMTKQRSPSPAGLLQPKSMVQVVQERLV